MRRLEFFRGRFSSKLVLLCNHFASSRRLLACYFRRNPLPLLWGFLALLDVILWSLLTTIVLLLLGTIMLPLLTAVLLPLLIIVLLPLLAVVLLPLLAIVLLSVRATLLTIRCFSLRSSLRSFVVSECTDVRGGKGQN